MKKTLLSILSLAAISNLSAQVTVTSADFPGIGDQVILVTTLCHRLPLVTQVPAQHGT